MKLVKRTASIVASLIILLAIGGFVFVRNFDLNKYKPYIQNEVEKATGRVLQINGDANLGISLIPTVVVNDVTFSNPDWAKSPFMARVKKVEVKFAILPLLHKQIKVSKFIVESPEIYLETSAAGINNWQFASKVTDKASAAATGNKKTKINDASAVLGIGLVAEDVVLRNGLVNYFDAKNLKSERVLFNKIELEVPADNQPMFLSVDAVYNNQKAVLETKINNLASILKDGKANFEAVVEALNVSADMKGVVENITKAPVYAIEADVQNPAGNFGAPAVNASIKVDGDTEKADVVFKNLNVAANEITGAATVNWSGKKPFVKVDMNASVFNVNNLAQNKMLSVKLPSLINEAQALSMVPSGNLPYEYLNILNGDFDLRAGKIILADGFELNNVVLVAKLFNGVLDVNKFDVMLDGGSLNSTAKVNALSKNINFALSSKNLKLTDLGVDADTTGIGGFKILSGGNLEIDANLTTFGDTYRKLSENINGNFVAVVDKSELRTDKADWLNKGILGQLWSILGIDTSKYSQFNVKCAVVHTDIKNGKAEFPAGIVFNSDELKIVGSGSLNLKDDNIDFTIAPMMNKLADGNITQALASFVKLGGTINKPKLELDKASALTTIVGSVATGGVYLGTEMLFNGDSDPCHNALQGTKFATKFGKSTGVRASGKNVYQNVSSQTKDAVKGLENAAKSLLGSFVGK